MNCKRQIKFSPPDISDKEIEAVAEVLKSGWITTGPKTKLFEQKIAEYCGTQKAVCLNSATACMSAALHILGVGPGDEVILPAYTYTATASVVIHAGATPVMIDIADNSFEMNYDLLEKAINEKTKVIMPVDLAGIMCDYKRIFEIIESKKGLFVPSNDIQSALGRIAVLADGAHSFGAMQNGKICGSIADFTSFSFHAVKNLTTAEGGALTWKTIPGIQDAEIYKNLMLYSLHGQSKDALSKNKPGAWEYDILYPAYKCNMTDIMSAIGLVQLERYGNMLAKRREIITYYNTELEKLGIGFLNHYSDNHASSGHLYLSTLTGRDMSFRNKLIEQLAERGIATNVHYKPLPLLSAYKNLGYDINSFPMAYSKFETELTLPLNTVMTMEDAEYVIENFKILLRG